MKRAILTAAAVGMSLPLLALGIAVSINHHNCSQYTHTKIAYRDAINALPWTEQQRKTELERAQYHYIIDSPCAPATDKATAKAYLDMLNQ